MFGNDLRDLLSDEEYAYIDNGTSINNLKGEIELSKRSNECRFTQVFVGNTSPRILKDSKGCIHVSQFYEDEDKGRNDFLKDKQTMGQIITDLWWFCVLDKDEYTKRCEKRGVDPNSLEVLEVETGGENLVLSWDAKEMFVNGDGSFYDIIIRSESK